MTFLTTQYLVLICNPYGTLDEQISYWHLEI